MNGSVILSHSIFVSVVLAISVWISLLLIQHLKIYDVPNERSSHNEVALRGGGIAIVVAFLVGIFLIQFLGDDSPIYARYFQGFFAAALLISALSLYDDIKCVSFKVKLAAQIVSVVLAMLSGIVIDVTFLPIWGEVHWGGWSYPITFLWMMGLTNAFNFIDGLDGIAATTAVVAAFFLAVISFQQGSHFIYLAALALSAACFGFLIFNWSPARIFMGDVGSTFLGFTFAVMAIIAARYDHSHTSFFVVPLLLFHFIFDTSFTLIRRLLQKKNVFVAHRTHLYQLLHQLGFSHGRVALLYAVLAIVQGLVAVWMMNNLGLYRYIVYFPFFFVYLFLAVWLVRRASNQGLLEG